MTRRRKWLLAAASLLGLVLLVAGVGRLMLSSHLRKKIVAAISERYGVEATAEDMSMSLLDGTASLEGFRVNDGGTTLLEAERVDVKAGIRDVLDGRMDFAKLVVVRPVLRLIVEKDGRTNLGRVLATPRPGPPAAGPSGIVVLRDARVEDGRIEFEDAVTDPKQPFRIVWRNLTVTVHELQLDGKPSTPCSADVRFDGDIDQPVFPARASIVAWCRPFGERPATYTLHGVVTGYDLTQVPQYVSAMQRATIGGDLIHLVADIEVHDGVIGPGAIVGEVDHAGTELPMRVGGTTSEPVFDVDSRLGTLLQIPLGRVGRFGNVALGAGWGALKGGANTAAGVGESVYGAGAAVGGGVVDAAGNVVAGDPLGALSAAGGGVVGGASALGTGLVEGVKRLVGLGGDALTGLAGADAAALEARFRKMHAHRRVKMLKAALASVPAGPAAGRRKRIEAEIKAADAK